jgi:catechol 2,3-dioxygenase-like lactoylglutathione lyase family enzyme
MKAREILETCLYVDDLDAAEEFYTRVLGLAVHGRQPGRHVFFRCGNRMLLLFDPRESSQSGAEFPPHGCRGPGHACFAALQTELPAWRAHLALHGVAIEKVIDWPGGGQSLYFRDPAGNSLEVATPRIWGIDERETLPSRQVETGEVPAEPNHVNPQHAR